MTRLVYYQRIKHTLQKIRNNNVQAPQNFNLVGENIYSFSANSFSIKVSPKNAPNPQSNGGWGCHRHVSSVYSRGAFWASSRSPIGAPKRPVVSPSSPPAALREAGAARKTFANSASRVTKGLEFGAHQNVFGGTKVRSRNHWSSSKGERE